MKVKLTPRKPGEKGGIACLPLVRNVSVPRAEDWKKVVCPVCGEECWESALAREAISIGTKAACTMCTLKAGFNMR